ncbi:MAG: diguanylate cyclase [Campylobacterota bacterium]
MKLLLLLIFITLSLEAKNREITLILPWKHQFQFAGYYVAKELGFYEKAGLNVDIQEFDLGSDVAKDVSTNRYEFGVGHSFLILDKLNKHPNIVFLNAIHQSSPMVFLSKKREDLKSLADIAGKKVMVSKEQIAGASINAMLFSEHVELDSYEVIEPSFNPVDLINGNTDIMTSYTSNEPYTLKQKGVEYTIFDPKDYGYDFYSDILFTTEEMIKETPKDVDSFREASLEGWKYAYEHIDEAIEIILKKYNTQSKTKQALEFEAETLKELAFKDDVNFGDINPIRLNEIATTYRLLDLVHSNSKVDFNSFIHKQSGDFKFDKQSLEIATRDYKYYFENIYFRLFILTFFIVIFVGLYFKSRMERLLKERTAQLELQNRIFDENISSSKTDLYGRITYVSEAFCKLTGYSKEELISKKNTLLKSEHTPKEVYKDLWLTISSGHIWRGEFKNIKKDGSEYWVKAIISPIFNKEKSVIAYESILQDITLKKVLESFNTKLESEVQKQTKELKQLAITDKLTGLYNRVKIDDELISNYNYFKEFNENFSIIILDIDLFKEVNDTHGHQIGDSVLIEMSKLLTQDVRSTDIVGRWGGEEFMIICPKTDLEHAYSLAQNIRKSIEVYNFPRVGNLTISAGISDMLSNSTLDSLVSKADTLLYDAKHSGRNTVKE